MFPITPEQWKQGLAQPSSDLCSKLVSMMNEFSNMYQIISWGVNPDGSLSDNARAWIGLATGSALQAPSNLTAVATATTVVLNWATVAAATSYDLYRSLAPNPPVVGVDTPLVAGLATNTFTDSAAVASTPPFAVGATYFYWTVARNASAVSGLSNMASTASGGAGGPTSPQNFQFGGAIQQFVVPANGLTFTITAYGAGGGGGAAYWFGPAGNPSQPYGGNGGGGGSGEKRITTLAGLAQGDILSIWVATPGYGGTKASGSVVGGINGDNSWVKNPAGTIICQGNGGLAGGGGGFQPATGGTAGAGGSGGIGPNGNTNGNAGAAGTPTGGGAGGTPLDSQGAGGAGGTSGNGAAGAAGYVTISW